jgi:uncharacterized protein YjiS (DUF1127 family)
MAFVTQNRRGLNALSLDISSKIYHVLQAWEDYRAYHRTVAELRELNTNQLADLGLNRSTIRSAAREAIYGA